MSRTIWTDEARSRVLEAVAERTANGESKRQICLDLDVPYPTVQRWLRGGGTTDGRWRAHEDEWAEKRRTSYLERKREQNKRYRALRSKRLLIKSGNKRTNLQRSHTFHEKHNPDLELAPLHRLWLPARRVWELIVEYADDSSYEALYRRLSHPGLSGCWTQLQEMMYDKRDWIRFDTADTLMTLFGIHPSEAGEPVYSGLTPKEDPPC